MGALIQSVNRGLSNFAAMPWRSNTGTPLLLRSSGSQASETESQSKGGYLPDVGETPQGDEQGIVEYPEDNLSGNGEDFSFEEFLRTGGHEFCRADSFHDFDEDTLLEDISEWNNRPGAFSSTSWEVCEEPVLEHPVVSHEEFSRIVASAVSSSASIECPVLPWERQPFKDIFSGNISNIPRLFVPVSNAPGLDMLEASLSQQVSNAATVTMMWTMAPSAGS